MNNQSNQWPTYRWTEPDVYIRYSISGYPFFLYINPDNQSRCLILATGTENTIPNDLPNSIAFHMSEQTRTLPAPEGQTKTLTLTLMEPLYSDHFDSLIDDVVSASNNTDNLQSAINESISRVSEWRFLFSDVPSEALSITLQTGLYGELLVLSKHLINAWGVPNAIKSWVGPEASNQDMTHNGCSIEVKSTAAVSTDTIPISNAIQLDDSYCKQLILVHLSLSRTRGSGQTLPDLVNEIRDMARDNGVGGLFENLLLKAQYDDKFLEQYSEFGFSLRETNYYKVSDGFPRLIEKTIPTGVINTRYHISTGHCTEYILDQANFIELVKGYE